MSKHKEGPPPHPVLRNIWTAPNRSRCHGQCQSRNMDMCQIPVLKWNISILVLNPNPNHSGCHGQWSSHCEMSNAGKLIRPGDIPRTQPFTQTISSTSSFFGYSDFLDILRYSWSGLVTFQGHNPLHKRYHQHPVFLDILVDILRYSWSGLLTFQGHSPLH